MKSFGETLGATILFSQLITTQNRNISDSSVLTICVLIFVNGCEKGPEHIVTTLTGRL